MVLQIDEKRGRAGTTVRRRTNSLFLPVGEAIMGKDGSHENCSACGNGSYKGEKLMCDVVYNHRQQKEKN